MSKKCPKIVFSAPQDNYLDIFQTIFRTFSGHFVDFLFLWAVQRFARCNASKTCIRLVFALLSYFRRLPLKSPRVMAPDLVAPYRAILRYPISRDTLLGGLSLPQNGAIPPPPPLILSFTQAHLCDAPLCNISGDNCAIPPLYEQSRSYVAIFSCFAC